MAEPRGRPQARGAGARARAAAPTANGRPEANAQVERFGQVVSKGLDFAEAGLSLGVTLIETLGNVAQRRLLDGAPAPAAPTAASPAPRVAAPAAGPPAPAEPPKHGGVQNRLPLVPGAPVNVSFSINNDSPIHVWEISLSVEPFVGQRTGLALPHGALVVEPSSALVGPMDFEKFVLRGALPPETPPDVYDGFVSGGAPSGVRIPVRLVVEGLGGP